MVGAKYLGNGECEFRVWAPLVNKVELIINQTGALNLAMQAEENGYWSVRAQQIMPGMRYGYRINQKVILPDPASHFQPEGVHKYSQVIDHAGFAWTDTEWSGINCQDMIIYELHVGAFTPAGTFQAIIPHLSHLKQLGINAIEIMPVAAFPGERNWGYDGVYPYAVQANYGGPDAFKQLINACHAQGIAVVLDVVYNHLGPEGNYFQEFGGYFTEKYRTPWGPALNFDDAGSDEVRYYFCQNALHWFEHYHLDALRLDAVQMIRDESAHTFLAELSETVKAYSRRSGRSAFLMAESDLNDARILQRVDQGGLGLHASWCDDLHHSLHAFCTGERQGYYQDFGSLDSIVRALREGYVFRGQYSRYRNRQYGNPQVLPGRALVVYSQNHDMVGNRCQGERTSRLLPWEALRALAGVVLLAPTIPLLFMGEEYGESAPFLYFVNHGDSALLQAVRDGRIREYGQFAWQKTPPDPAQSETFLRSKLQWELREKDKNKKLEQFYTKLIQIRKKIQRAETRSEPEIIFQVQGYEAENTISLQRGTKRQKYFCWFHLGHQPVVWGLQWPNGLWKKVLDSEAVNWGGTGSLLPETMAGLAELNLLPFQMAVYSQEQN